MDTLENKLVIISGASRGIGKEFKKYFAPQPNTISIGLGRHKSLYSEIQLDLLQKNEVNKFVEQLDLTKITKIIYLHSIGIDKFESDGKPHIDNDGDGIDDEVYSSNVTTFMNLATPLIDKSNKTRTPLTLVQIASISDFFRVPYWTSFYNSKNIVRQFFKSNSSEFMHGVTLNICSTIDDEGRKYGRPFANTTYWQKAEDLVKKSINFIEKHEPGTGHKEQDFFEPNPSYRSDYFTDLERLYEIWQKDMGFEDKLIPRGIRI